jgi:hypothetical protein
MSRIEFKECPLEQATHVEMGGYLYKIGSYEVRPFRNSDEVCVGINVILSQHDERTIRHDLFPILGIKPMRQVEREPIEFEFIVSLNTLSFFPPLNVPMEAVGKKFKCVEILEGE